MAVQNVAIKSSGKKGTGTFSPSPLQAKGGDTVAWTNNDVIQHWPTPKTGPAWFNQAINPNATSPLVPVSNTDYFCKIHPNETGSIQVAVAPQLKELTIVPGGSLPSAQVNGNDSVFWLNNTTQNHQLVYNSPTGPVPWGQPPTPLSPRTTSSQVLFPNPSTATQVYNYSCTIHPSEKGTITVKKV